MKKLIALLIAMMMLTISVASAESVLSISDLKMSTTTDGEETTIDLTGLELCIAGDELEDGVIGLKIYVNGNGETLYTVDVNIVGDTLLMTATGLSSVLTMAIPEELPTEELDLSDGFELPDEAVEKITNILMESMEVDEENGTVRIPYTAVNDILGEALPYLDPAKMVGVDLEQFKAQLDEMKANDSGFDLVGSFASEDESGFAADFSVYTVDGGVVADEAAFGMTLAASDNGFALAVDAGEAGGLLVTYAEGQVAFALEAGDNSFALAAKIAEVEADVALTKLDPANAIDIENLSDEDSEALGTELTNGLGDLMNYVFSILAPAEEEPAA